MFVPLHDGVPLRHMRVPYASYGIIGLSVVFWLINWLFVSPEAQRVLAAGTGLIPAVLFGHAALPEGLWQVPAPLTFVSSLWVHLSFLHLLGNMLFLWVFADNVEDALGHWTFLLFYLLCGATGALLYALGHPTSEQPLIGASSAVSGVAAAYLVLHPRVKVWGLFLNRIPLRLPALWCIGGWLALQIGASIWASQDDVGWLAHVGGFAAGLLLVIVLYRPDEPLRQRFREWRWPGVAAAARTAPERARDCTQGERAEL